MLTPALYKSLEERLGPVVGIAAGAAVVLNTVGYLSLRFRLRALGIDPDVGWVDEVYLFEGAGILFYLLAILPLLLIAATLVVLVGTLARKVDFLARWIDAMIDGLRAPSPHWAATIGAVWTVVTVHFFLGHILQYRDLAHRGIPCEPEWMATIALAAPLGKAAFFCVLLLMPFPTLWAVDRLAHVDNLKPVAILLSLVVVLQVLLIPVYHGVLIAHADVPRLTLPDAEPGTQTWEIFRSGNHYHLLVQDTAQPANRRLRSVPDATWDRIDVESMDSLFEILMAGRICP